MLAPPPVHLPADPAAEAHDPQTPATAIAHPDSPLVWASRAEQALDALEAVSYTHLTLPTICSV